MTGKSVGKMGRIRYHVNGLDRNRQIQYMRSVQNQSRRQQIDPKLQNNVLIFFTDGLILFITWYHLLIANPLKIGIWEDHYQRDHIVSHDANIFTGENCRKKSVRFTEAEIP